MATEAAAAADGRGFPLYLLKGTDKICSRNIVVYNKRSLSLSFVVYNNLCGVLLNFSRVFKIAAFKHFYTLKPLYNKGAPARAQIKRGESTLR